jgi:hypothetical protein
MSDVLRPRRPQPLPDPSFLSDPFDHIANVSPAAPAPAPPLQPASAGAWAGYGPTTTLGAQIGRWYDNAGGLDAAISGAQEAQKNRDPRVLDGLLWPKWKPGDVTKRMPQAVNRVAGLDNGTNGQWHAGTTEILLRAGEDPATGEPLVGQGALEHELSHNAFSRNADTTRQQRDPLRADARDWIVPHGDDYKAYLLSPPEVDVRLAEIKRHYAHHTGRLVDSPEEAQKAWEWWRWNQLNFMPGFDEQIERPGDNPTLDPEDFYWYDSQPPQMKEQMLHRMPELVSSRREDSIRQYQNAIRNAPRNVG